MQVGQAIANAVIQGAAGAKNGIEGVVAGVANGLLGGITKLAGPIESGMLKGITPGLGITYSPDNGWGGMIGLGNTIQNASISFSQHGDTTVKGSYSLGDSGVQLAGDVTTNGAANIGLNYNPTGEGPRRDWNFSLMYDMAGTGLSASAGYTHPGSTIGLTSTINRDGLSTSAELTGVSIATNGPNGFQMDELNFAEQNINAAQDKTQDDQYPKGIGSDDSPPNDNDFFDDMTNAGTALAGLLAGGAAFVTGLYSGSPTPAAGRPATPTPSASETVVLERDRRREEDDNSDVADHQDLDRNNDTPGSDLANSDSMDQMNPSLDNDYENGSDSENPRSAILDPPTSVDNDISPGQGAFQAPVESTEVTIGYDPSKEYTMDGSYNLSQPVKDGILNILDGFIPDLSLPNLGIPDHILSNIASLLSGEGMTTPMAGQRDIPGWLRAFGPLVGLPISFTESGNGNNSNDSLVKKPGEKLPPPMEPNTKKYQELKSKVLKRFFGKDKDKSGVPAKVYVEELLNDSNLSLSDAEKNYLRGYTLSLYKDQKTYATMKKDYENGKIPDTYKPKVGFVPLLPGVTNVNMNIPEGDIPTGGRDVTIGTVNGIREYDINLDRKDLKSRVEDMNEHNIKDPSAHKTDIQIEKEKGVGTNTNVRYNILGEGKDANGNTLWTTYSFHKEDSIHQFTNKESAELFVNGALKWREYQIKNGIQPISPLKLGLLLIS
ncbi:hypothetical protein [Leptospira bandrabouensis]|uniref:hypothetical protein n=1 Tax=Leptospira bandrabouensis TaxID=2484903 RepID=UPI001EE956FA|nr:hypothetical protein [Leptospira bandrabouensis]MCG6144514.1 hypothetical protein [Leptospira bandrabouensis]MCG6160175.1 hypothetical protein [Leptospira bandrabouensis]MCG6164108.1 hypothetical protein [Leptospira bandrabouensis]